MATSSARGCLLAIPASVGLCTAYAFVLLFIENVARRLWFGGGNAALHFAARVNVAITVLLCIAAIVVAVRLARRGKPGYAVMLVLTAIFGLVPASACTAGLSGL